MNTMFISLEDLFSLSLWNGLVSPPRSLVIETQLKGVNRGSERIRLECTQFEQ